MSRNLGRIGVRQHRHRRSSPRLFAVFAACGHIGLGLFGLAGIKLSMILDNLVATRHDHFVTTGRILPMPLPGHPTP
jgi:hypothetical protein